MESSQDTKKPFSIYAVSHSGETNLAIQTLQVKQVYKSNFGTGKFSFFEVGF